MAASNAPHVGRWTKIIGIAIAVGFLAVWLGWNHETTAQAQGGENSNAQPANKIAMSGGSIMFLGPTAGNDQNPAPVVAEILRGTLKTSSPTDLIVSLNMECALWTEITALNDEDAQSMASVKAWIEIDGIVVKVSSNDAQEPGKVVFCNRTHGMEINFLDDEDAEFRQYMETRTANSFEWLSLNVGSGTHTVVVKAELDSQVVGQGAAHAGVGKRTLVVEPVKLANNASI